MRHAQLPIQGRVIAGIVAPTAIVLVAGLVVGAVLAGRLEASGYLVSRKGRAFLPSQFVIARGDTVTIVNDDSDRLHHPYIEAMAFTFDSGDQAPGSRTPVTFDKAGTFQVLRGIHPKMRLTVRVA